MAVLLSRTVNLKNLEALYYFSKMFSMEKKDLPEGAVPHLLSLAEEYCGPLCDLLCKYHDVFPG